MALLCRVGIVLCYLAMPLTLFLLFLAPYGFALLCMTISYLSDLGRIERFEGGGEKPVAVRF